MTHLHLHRLRTAQTGVKYEPSCYGTNKMRLVAVVTKSAPPRGQSEQAPAERPRSWPFERVPQRKELEITRNLSLQIKLLMKTCSFTDENDQFEELSNKLLLFQKTKWVQNEFLFRTSILSDPFIMQTCLFHPMSFLNKVFKMMLGINLTSLINQSENTKRGLTWAGSEQVFRHNVKISSSWRVDLGKSSFSLFA